MNIRYNKYVKWFPLFIKPLRLYNGYVIWFGKFEITFRSKNEKDK